jgi:diguanylate cyclase (GGDEF)-like protein
MRMRDTGDGHAGLAITALLGFVAGVATGRLARAARRRPPALPADQLELLTSTMARLRASARSGPPILTQPTGTDTLMGELALTLVELFGADSAEILLLDDLDGALPGPGALRTRARAGDTEALTEPAEIDQATSAWIAGLGSVAVTLESGWPEGLLDPARRRPPRNGIAAALPGPAGPRGLIVVAASGRFDPVELRLLEAIAEHATISLDNTRLSGDLLHQARHDPLTGLPNRTLLRDRLGAALARGGRADVAVLFLDLDGFKEVNDRLGHHAGDQILVAAGRRLRAALRTADMLARFAGDEFVIVSEDLESDQAAGRIADRLLAALTAPFSLGDREAHIGASIGIVIGRGGEEPEELIARADAAMYAAKQAGKGRWVAGDEAGDGG